jgi:hypothetical protein
MSGSIDAKGFHKCIMCDKGIGLNDMECPSCGAMTLKGRLERIKGVVDSFCKDDEDAYDLDIMTDIFADLFHEATRRGYDPEQMVEEARVYFNEEIAAVTA